MWIDFAASLCRGNRAIWDGSRSETSAAAGDANTPGFSHQAMTAALYRRNICSGRQGSHAFLKIFLFALEILTLSAGAGAAAQLTAPPAIGPRLPPPGAAGSHGKPRGPRRADLSRSGLQVHSKPQRASRQYGHDLVAIVMDDLGPDATATRQAILLPSVITLSFLPYARDVAEQARAATARGHEVIVHVPMEPLGRECPGPRALRVGLSAAQNRRRLSWDLSRVPGADGINNHMGSRFTADRAALVPVLGLLSTTKDFFFDSRTTAKTQVVTLARSFGILSAGRDVFLDDVQRRKYILGQLRQLLRLAERNGVAIAIGHPHVVTLQAITWWIAHHPGLHLVTLRAAVRLKARNAGLLAAGKAGGGD